MPQKTNHSEAFELACYQRENSNLARSYLELHALLKEIHDKLEYGDVYQWDDGDECWKKMRDLCAQRRLNRRRRRPG